MGTTGDATTAAPGPRARRLPRPRWLDARLLVGVGLVLGSVLLGARVVAAADDTYPVWALTRDLGPGAVVAAGDVRRVDVRLGAAAPRYLAGDASPVGFAVTRRVAAGELLPRDALAAEPGGAARAFRQLVVEVPRTAARGLRRGAVVDMYAVPTGSSAAAAGAAPTPRLVVAGVTVADDVDAGGGRLGAGSTRVGVSLRLDAEDVPAVLAAQAAGSVTLVSVPAGG